MALESSTAATRPTHWTYASPDLNVLLSGHLVTPLDGAHTAQQHQQLAEGAQFQLDTQGIYIVRWLALSYSPALERRDRPASAGSHSSQLALSRFLRA